RFQTITMGQGANMALPIYALFLEKVFNDGHLGVNPTDTWDKPLRGLTVNIDCNDQAISNENQFEGSEDDFF
ncbi:MAG: hypothetical protein PHS05_06655, partial [Bacteroidales bacterium]|nr:hypothetical protein [Bacteroidales bacterium]